MHSLDIATFFLAIIASSWKSKWKFVSSLETVSIWFWRISQRKLRWILQSEFDLEDAAWLCTSWVCPQSSTEFTETCEETPLEEQMNNLMGASVFSHFTIFITKLHQNWAERLGWLWQVSEPGQRSDQHMWQQETTSTIETGIITEYFDKNSSFLAIIHNLRFRRLWIKFL